MALGMSPEEIVSKGEYQLLCKASHWERVALDDVSRIQNGFAFKSEFFDRDDGVPLIRIRDISSIETEHKYRGTFDNEYIVSNGDILIGMDGDFTASIWKGQDALLNQRVCRLELESSNYDKRFFFLCLQPYLNAINAETSSVTVKHLSSKTVRAIPLPLPPLAEQRRIVSKLDQLFSELDNGIECLHTAYQQLNVYRQALLKHAFEGKLTDTWRKDNKDSLPTSEKLLEHIKSGRKKRGEEQIEEWKVAVKAWEKAKMSGKKPSKPRNSRALDPLADSESKHLADLPDGWCWDKLGWMTCGVEYGTSAKSSEIGAMPVLRMGNIQNGKFDWTDLVYTSHQEEIAKYKLSAGDVLFNRTNSPELVGKTAIFRGERQAIFAGYLIRVNQNPAVADSQYLNLYLNSHTAKQHGKQVKTDGVNQSNINGEKLQNYPFPFCSIEEQEEIVRILEEKLSIIDQMQADILKQLSVSSALRQSILKRAFSGQLVEQDPNDEPAFELLARIKTEKEKRERATKAAKKKVKKKAKRKDAA